MQFYNSLCATSSSGNSLLLEGGLLLGNVWYVLCLYTELGSVTCTQSEAEAVHEKTLTLRWWERKKEEELHTDDEDGTRAGSEQLKQVGGWEDSFFRI